MDNKQIISSGQENQANGRPLLSRKEYTERVVFTTIGHIVITPLFFTIGLLGSIYDGPKDNIFVIIFFIFLFVVFIAGPFISYANSLVALRKQYKPLSASEKVKRRPYEIAVIIIIVLVALFAFSMYAASLV